MGAWGRSSRPRAAPHLGAGVATRDGERRRMQGTGYSSRRVAEIAGTSRSAQASLRESGHGNGIGEEGLQPARFQGATELGFPRPAPGEICISFEAARRAGAPSHQERNHLRRPACLRVLVARHGLPDTRPAPIRANRPAGQVMRHRTWTASQAPLAAKRADGMLVQPDAVNLRSPLWRSRPRRGGDDPASRATIAWTPHRGR